MKIAFLREYAKQLKDSRIRLAAGGLFAILTVVFSLRFVEGKSLILCILLGIGCGGCIGIPKPRLSLKQDILLDAVLFVIYAVYVPKRIFWRTEFAVGNDMAGMFPGAGFLNICILVILFFGLLMIFQRISLALGITGICCLLFTIINHYVTAFRGSSLSVLDLKATRTAMTVIGAYTYKVSPELWKSVLYDLFFIMLGFRIDVKLKGLKYHAVMSGLAVAGLIISICVYKFSGYWQVGGIHGENGNIRAGEKAFGAYLYLIISGDAGGMQKPSGYSDSTITEIAGLAKAQYGEYQEENINPNIIFIMNETWSDLQVLGNLEVTGDYMEFYHSLDKNTKKGYVYVDVLGGMTCNSEFEALTGDAMSLLDIAAIPYEMQVNHNMESLASVLKEQGYYTFAMHPNVGASWNRGKVYEYFGFDEFHTMQDFVNEREMVGNFTSDKSDFEELIYCYEHRDKSRPFFAFNVTIQNHSGYWDQTPVTVELKKIGITETNGFGEVKEFLSLMKLTDDALRMLIEYFEEVDEPVIVCMFGDHQPHLEISDIFYDRIFEGTGLTEEEQTIRKYITPYLIWANYDIEEKTPSGGLLPFRAPQQKSCPSDGSQRLSGLRDGQRLYQLAW